MTQFFEHNINNRDLILMVSKDANSKMAMEALHQIFKIIPEKLTSFIRAGMDAGLIRSDLDPSMLCSQILDPFFVQTLFAETNKSFKQKSALDASFRAHFIDHQLKVLLEGIEPA